MKPKLLKALHFQEVQAVEKPSAFSTGSSSCVVQPAHRLTAGAAEGLVRGGGDHVGVVEGGGDHARRNQTGDVRRASVSSSLLFSSLLFSRV